MADTGKIATSGFGAGAIKYVVLDGFIPNPGGSIVNACLVTMGFGASNAHKIPLLGLVGGTSSSGGGFCMFGGAIITGVRVRDL